MNYSSWDSNYPQNATQDAWFDSVVTISTALILAIIILITAIGNVFVISVILLERHLQSVANYLILSLAVADLLVACLVMPLGAVYVVTQQQWFLGPALCDMWTSSDVLCCTASILHLVAIAADRYWAVTSVDYIQNRTTKRIVQMIVLIWAISLLISLGPPLGWKDDEWHHRVEVMKNCLVSQDVAYQVFATIATFYLPLAIILFLYWRIFLAAQKRIRRKPHSANNRTSCPSGRLTSSLPAVSLVSETTTTTMMSSSPAQPHCVTFQAEMQRPSAAKRRNVESKRERKAAKTLAIITGAFVICWLPFFVVALLMPLCPESCSFDGHMISFFLWLGYLNSTLNPVLYTIFSPEFRNAFQKLLGINKRMIPGQRGDQLEQRSIAVSNTSG